MRLVTQLFYKSLFITEEMNMLIACFKFTNIYTQRIADKLELKTLLELKYEDSYANYVNMPLEIKNVQKSCCIIAKRL